MRSRREREIDLLADRIKREARYHMLNRVKKAWRRNWQRPKRIPGERERETE
jgi:hypothetical protein